MSSTGSCHWSQYCAHAAQMVMFTPSLAARLLQARPFSDLLPPESFGNRSASSGLQHWIPIVDYPDDHWDKVIAVMLSAPFHLTKRCLPAMKQKGLH